MPRFLILETSMNIESGFLNGSGTEKRGKSNITLIKKFLIYGNKPVPYVSAQCLRKWFKESFLFANTDQRDYYDWVYTFNPLSEKTNNPTDKTINPVKYLVDDLFGYSHPLLYHKILLEKNLEEKKNPVISTNRMSPIRSSILFPLIGSTHIGIDYGYVHLPDDSPLPYSSQFYSGYFTYSAGLELSRIGIFSNYGDQYEIDPDLAEFYVKEGKLTKRSASNKIIYTLEENLLKQRRNKALKEFLNIILYLSGGSKGAAFSASLSPKTIIIALSRSGNLIFQGLIEYQTNKKRPMINIESLQRTLEFSSDNILEKEIYIGLYPGYLENEEEVRDLNGKELSGIMINIESFKTIFEKIISKFNSNN